jgi:hypothetical protein
VKNILSAFLLLAAALPLQAVTVVPLVGPKAYFTDNNGKPCSGCKFWTYLAGTTTPQLTYSDPAGTVANTNPVILDASGRADIFIIGNPYKFVLETKSDLTHGTVLWTQDNYTAGSIAGVTFPVSVPNGGTGLANIPLGDLLIGAGAAPLTPLAPTPPLNYLRVKPNVVTPAFEMATLPTVSVRDYNWPAQTPGGTLSGAATVTLSPCPLGMATTGGYKMYLSGGTGAAEAVTITGGTCTAGAASGTVQFTAANGHSGAWTIASATGGYQEAYNAQNGCGSALLPNGPRVVMHASVVMASVCNFSWQGQALQNSSTTGPSLIQRGDDFLSGDMFSVGDGVGAEFRNFEAVNEPITTGVSTGWAVNALGVTGNGVGYIHIDNFQVYGGAGGVLLDGVSTSNIHDYVWTKFSGANTGIGILFRSTHGISNQSSIITHGYFATTTFATTGIGITGLTDGVIAASNLFGGSFSAADVDVALNVPSDGAFNITLNDNFFDAPNGAGVRIGGSAGALITNVTIVGNHFGGSYDPATKPTQGCGIDLGFTFANNAQNVTIASNRLFGWALGGICLGAGSGENSWLVNGNNILNNGNSAAADHVGIVIKDGSHGLTITGNNITNSMAGATASQDYAIKMQGALSDSTITGNNLRGNNLGAVLYTGTLANVLLNPNGGIDDATIPTIASAASIALSTPIPTYLITGTVTVNTITGATHIQERRTFIKTDAGTLTVGGGGNIPIAHSMVPNAALTLTWNGTNWY